jgi:hypothetical protein
VGFGIPELVVVLLEHDLGTEVNVNTLARAVIYNPANRRALATLLKKRAALAGQKSKPSLGSCLDSQGRFWKPGRTHSSCDGHHDVVLSCALSDCLPIPLRDVLVLYIRGCLDS